MHLAGRDHGRNPAMEIAVDPVDLALTRRPIPSDRMHVAVDETGGESHAISVDHGRSTADVNIAGAADRRNPAVRRHDGVGLENRPAEIAAQQQADILDDQLARSARLLRIFRGHGLPPLAQAPGSSIRSLSRFGKMRRGKGR
jgi:hypothetical protein